MNPARFTLRINAMQAARFVPGLRQQVRAVHKKIVSRLTDLSLALVDDRTMIRLHLQFMNLPGPTDVLTFPLELDAAGQVIGGEVVVCVPEARRRSVEHGTRLQDELLLYTVHGMLHLSGYDDHTHRDYRRMHQKEDEILIQLGVGAVFRPARAGAATPRQTRTRLHRPAATRAGGGS